MRRRRSVIGCALALTCAWRVGAFEGHASGSQTARLPARPRTRTKWPRESPSPSPASRRTDARSRSRRAATSGRCRRAAATRGCSSPHEATERRPLFSPDGRQLAFVSTRTGGGDIYVLTLATGDVRRLTWDDGAEQLEGWSRDSRWIYFSSTSRDIAGMNDIFRVPAAGGTPMAVTDDRYTNEFGAAPSPDGQRLAFSRARHRLDAVVAARAAATRSVGAVARRSRRDRQRWRRDDRAVHGDHAARRAPACGRCGAGDGRSLFYVSDRGGAENVWTRPANADGRDRALTTFRTAACCGRRSRATARRSPSSATSASGRSTRPAAQAREVPIARRGAPTSPAPERVRQTIAVQRSRAVAGRPQGRVRRARRRVRGVGEGRRRRDARDRAPPIIESQPVWAPDSRRLAYVVGARRRSADLSLRLRARTPRRRSRRGPATDLSPVFSPDGKSARVPARTAASCACSTSRRSRIASLATGPVRRHDRHAAAGLVARRQVDRALRDRREGVHERRARAGRPAAPRRPVSFLANVFANTIAWSRDGSYPALRHAASAPSPASSRASISRCGRRSSARICSAISSPSPRESAGRPPRPPATSPNRSGDAPAAPPAHACTAESRVRGHPAAAVARCRSASTSAT